MRLPQRWSDNRRQAGVYEGGRRRLLPNLVNLRSHCRYPTRSGLSAKQRAQTGHLFCQKLEGGRRQSRYNRSMWSGQRETVPKGMNVRRYAAIQQVPSDYKIRIGQWNESVLLQRSATLKRKPYSDNPSVTETPRRLLCSESLVSRRGGCTFKNEANAKSSVHDLINSDAVRQDSQKQATLTLFISSSFCFCCSFNRPNAFPPWKKKKGWG